MRIRAKAVDMAVAPSVSEGSGGAVVATSGNHCAAPPPRPLALARGDSLVIARFSGASRLPPPPPVSFPQARRMRRQSLGINWGKPRQLAPTQKALHRACRDRRLPLRVLLPDDLHGARGVAERRLLQLPAVGRG